MVIILTGLSVGCGDGTPGWRVRDVVNFTLDGHWLLVNDGPRHNVYGARRLFPSIVKQLSWRDLGGDLSNVWGLLAPQGDAPRMWKVESDARLC